MNKDLGRQVAEKIKEIRRKKNFTQADLAHELRLSHSAIKTYECGRVPNAEILLRLADIGEVSVDWILGRKEMPLMRLVQKKNSEIDIDYLWEIFLEWADRGMIDSEERHLKLLLELAGSRDQERKKRA